MDNTRLHFLFQRYISGLCTSREELELMRFITENDTPDVKRLLEELWEQPSGKLSPEKADNILSGILSNTPERNLFLPQDKKKFFWMKAAAVIALILLAGIAYDQLTAIKEIKNIPVHTAKLSDQHQFIKLPDGSKVILNEASTLEYPDSFKDKKSREVYLTGEAFFDIRHDASKIFIVHTGKLKTTVLGTAFNVKAYPNQNDITVTVTRGKVKVSDETKVLGIITPDQQITFQKESRHTEQKTVKSSEAVAWASKDIFFDDVSMAEAALQLEARFNVTITFANENIKKCRFTATFIKGEDLNQILEVICAFNQAQYQPDESGNIEIYGTGCSL